MDSRNPLVIMALSPELLDPSAVPRTNQVTLFFSQHPHGSFKPFFGSARPLYNFCRLAVTDSISFISPVVAAPGEPQKERDRLSVFGTLQYSVDNSVRVLIWMAHSPTT